MSYNNTSNLRIEDCYQKDQTSIESLDEFQRNQSNSLSDLAFKYYSQENPTDQQFQVPKSILQDNEPLTYEGKINSDSEDESNFEENSSQWKSDKNEARELLEINIANEINQQNATEKELKPFVTESNSFLKENRPWVYEYQDNLNPLINKQPGKCMKNSAEFTFSKFKAALEANNDTNFTETSEQPYKSQRKWDFQIKKIEK